MMKRQRGTVVHRTIDTVVTVVSRTINTVAVEYNIIYSNTVTAASSAVDNVTAVSRH